MVDWLARGVSRAARKLRVRSALNPMLWLSAIALPICIGAAYAFRADVPVMWVLLIAGLFPIGTTCVGFVYFAITQPERLQSEDYQLRHETLQMIQQKVGSLELDPTSLAAIANPSLPSLPALPAGSKEAS